MCTDERAGFSQAKKEANGHDPLRALSRGCSHGKTSPCKQHGRKKDARRDIVEDQIRRDHSNDISAPLLNPFSASSTHRWFKLTRK